jgi:hypothetical protein
MPNAMESRARTEREVMAKLHTRIFAPPKTISTPVYVQEAAPLVLRGYAKWGLKDLRSEQGLIAECRTVAMPKGMSFGRRSTRGIKYMSDIASEFERLLGHTVLELWPDLARDAQEPLFEAAVPINPAIRNSLAMFIHDGRPRTAHPPRPTRLT